MPEDEKNDEMKYRMTLDHLPVSDPFLELQTSIVMQLAGKMNTSTMQYSKQKVDARHINLLRQTPLSQHQYYGLVLERDELFDDVSLEVRSGIEVRTGK